MKLRIPLACALAIVVAYATDAPADATAVLSIHLVNFRNDHGRAGCALYDSDKGFPKDTSVALFRTWCPIQGTESTCRFPPIAAGSYAVACFHDENANGKCDTGMFGIPTEGTVVSNHAKGFMSAPSYKDARFTFSGSPTELRLRAGY